MKDRTPQFPRAYIIRRTQELRRYVERWRKEPLLALDTESNSLYAYYEQVCLVQLSTREQDFIIDPLALDDMSPLGALLADPQIEIVFHAAEYDIISLKRDFGFEFAHIFDTMLAARICGWKRIGLGNILAEHFGVRAEKKYQRADWAQRPLPPEQLLYAQMDTHFLPALRDHLHAELEALGRLEEAHEIFAELPRLAPAQHTFDPEGYWRIHGVRDMPREKMGIVRELYLLRDAIARRRNKPVFKIFSDQTLLHLAKIAPRRHQDLYTVKGLSSRLARSEGDAILEAVARGKRSTPPTRPKRTRHVDPQVLERYDALQHWRKRRAAERGVESDIILGRETMWALAHAAPTRLEDLADIPGLGPWRRAEYGEELVALLARKGKGRRP